VSFGRCVWFCPLLVQRFSINFYGYFRFKSSVNTTNLTKIGLYVTNLECIGKTIPVQSRTGPEGSRSLIIPDFQENRDMAKLSALRTGRLYPPGRTPGTHFCSKLSRTQCHSVGGRIMSSEHATFGLVALCLNQLRHLVAYSRVGTANVLYTQIMLK